LTFAFLIAAIVIALALVLAIIQREVPLRTMGGAEAAAHDAAEAAQAAEANGPLAVQPRQEAVVESIEQPAHSVVGSGGPSVT
jgi:hypothetical protein